MRTGNMESDNLKPSDETTSAGTFFRKYGPRQSPSPSADNRFFKKYDLAQNEEADGLYEQPEPVVQAPADDDEYRIPDDQKQTTKPASVFTRLRLLSALALAAMLLGALYTNNWRSAPAAESRPQPVEAVAPQSEPQPHSEAVEAEHALDVSDTVSLAKRRRKNPAQMQKANDPAFRSLLLTSLLVRARNLEDRGMLVDAVELYRIILREFPDQRPSQIALDRIENILFDRERDERARVAREAGLKKFRLGDYAGAEPDLTIAVDAGRTDTATLYALGMSHLRLKNYSQAMAVLNSCLAANPDYAPALVGLAQIKLFTGEKEQALSLLNRALELGGGAEFTPAKIRDMISSLNSKVSALPRRPTRNPS